MKTLPVPAGRQKLKLARETLRSLNDAQLAHVRGGGGVQGLAVDAEQLIEGRDEIRTQAHCPRVDPPVLPPLQP